MPAADHMDCTRFRFVPLGGSAPQGAISCDGVVGGASLHLTHWKDNRTPTALKADTSTEIALNFVGSPLAEAWKHSAIVNNHFDTDGVLCVATLLDPELARAHRELFIAAAEVGDFQEWPQAASHEADAARVAIGTATAGANAGVRLDVAALRLDAAITALGAQAPSERAAYASVLPQLAQLIAGLDAREDLWGPAWTELRDGLVAVNDGRVIATRNGRISVLRHTHAFHASRATPSEPIAAGAQADEGTARRELAGPVLHRLHPEALGRWLLFELDEHQFHARYEHPRHAWADTVVRRKPDPVDAAALARTLGPAWRPCPAQPGSTGLVETAEPVTDLPDLATLLSL